MKVRKNKKNRVIISRIVALVIIMIAFVVKLNNKQEYFQMANFNREEKLGKEENQGNVNKEERNENKDESNTILDNSNYLELNDDPNADDAIIVAENTKGLLTGTKLYPVRRDGKKVAYLTFDDGPSTTNTPSILDILDLYNIKATFFVVGKLIEDNQVRKNILRDTVKRGHAIANHTYSHDYSYLYPNRIMNVNNIVADFEKNSKILKAVLGKDFSTRVIRFPGGYWSWNGREDMKEKIVEKEYCNVDWNALNEDAEGKEKNAEELVQRIKENVEILGPNADNVVILMHDTYGKEETVKSLPIVIEYLQSKGYEFRTIK